MQKYERSCDFDKRQRPDPIRNLQKELTPVHLFQLFFYVKLSTVQETNKYAPQRNKELNVTDSEIKGIT